MRYETQQVRIGEYLGPVDWSYDFTTSGYARHEEILEMFRKIEAAPDKYEATTDGGWPRFGWQRVLQVGMYDGWPYWRPVPSFFLSGVLGPEWHSWCSLSDIRELVPVVSPRPNQHQETP